MNYLKTSHGFFTENVTNYNDFANIVVSTGKDYTRAMGVLVFSILKNIKKPVAIHIFYNGKKLLQKEEERIKYLAYTWRCPINVYYLNNAELEQLYTAKNITIATYYRLLAPYILKEHQNIKRIVYFDVDMLCVNDISELFTVPLGNNVAYVVKGFTSTPEWWNQYCTSLGMKGKQYFNSGMLMIDTDNYIKMDIGNKAIALALKKSYKYMDQDILNILLEGKVIFDTTCRYNCTMSVKNEEFLPKDVKIIHFTGGKKPWKLYTVNWSNFIHPRDESHSWKYQFYDLWRQYAMLSPWKDIPYDELIEYTEWRYLSQMQWKTGLYLQSICSYFKYLKLKIIELLKAK